MSSSKASVLTSTSARDLLKFYGLPGLATVIGGYVLLKERTLKTEKGDYNYRLIEISKFYGVLKYVFNLMHDVVGGREAFQSRAARNKRDTVNKLLGILWPRLTGSRDETAGRNQLLSLLLLGIVKVGVLHFSAQRMREVSRAANAGQQAQLLDHFKLAVPLLFAGSMLSSLTEYNRESLALVWRDKLTRLIHNEYFKLMNYYTIGNLQKPIVDPDERLAREVTSVSKRLSMILSLLARSLPTFAFFTWQLYRIKGWKYTALPIAYFVVAYEVAQRVFPKNIGILYRKMAGAVGSYFSSVTRVQTHGESIAALGGSELEHKIVQSKFKGVSGAKRAVFAALSKRQVIFNLAYTYGSRTWIGCLIMYPFLSRPVSNTSQSVAQDIAELQILRTFMLEMLVANGQVLTLHANAEHMSGSAYRVTSLLETLKTLSSQQASKTSATMQHSNEEIKFENVQVYTPTKVHLVKDLSFSLKSDPNDHQGLLLTGHNGAGKSSIFRCLGGLWEADGKITKPSEIKDVFYLPQKPYNVLGTLTDQLTYPLKEAVTPELLKELLERVDLGHLLEQDTNASHSVVNWEEKLSLGEQQRLAMARLFYHKPRFAVLDECTSAVPHGMEKLLYSECQRLGIAYITICHRPALKAYHDVNLNLKGDGKGGWETKPLTRERTAVHHHSDIALTDRDRHKMQLVDDFTKKRSEQYKNSFVTPPMPQRSALSKLLVLMKIVLPGSLPKLAALVAMIAARTICHEAYGVMTGSMYNAVMQRDKSGFFKLALSTYAMDMVHAVIDESVVYLQNEVGVTWNENLSRHLTDKFFRDSSFYTLRSLDRRIRDPDQRLTQEVQELSESLAGILSHAITPLVDISYFSYRLYSAVGSEGMIPLYGYIATSGLVSSLFMPDYKQLNTREKELESRFRFVHTRLRNHAESIAFFGGGPREKEIADNAITELVKQSQRKVTSNCQYKFVYLLVNKDFDDITGAVRAPDLVTAWMQMTNASTASHTNVAKESFYLSTITDRTMKAFGKLSNLYEDLSDWLGSAQRVVEMLDVMDEMSRSGKYSDKRLDVNEADLSSHIEMQHVDIVTPAGVCLAQDINMAVQPGKALMVTGITRGGKTSLFRVLAGLWPVHGGNAALHRPARSQLMLVPQKSYSVNGTLRDLVTYPTYHGKFHPAPPSEEGKVLTAMKKAGILHLTEREGGLDAVLKWEDTLSLGEQQRMGLARLFYHQPAFAVIDEATDAVSAEQEELLYATMHELGITCITISKRLNLPQFHSQKIHLSAANDNGYTLHDLNDDDSAEPSQD